MRWFVLSIVASVYIAAQTNNPVFAQEKSPSANSIFSTRESANQLPLPKGEDVFHFVIYGDRTGGEPAGLEVLRQAVKDTNLLDPDLVMTVGDLVQGYNRTPQWLRQAEEFKEIMDDLNMAWFPVAGNHDVYWDRRDRNKPAGQHESNYETHFGPLWYSFQHKNAGFVVLYSDEGDPETNEKGFNEGRLQQMSPEQLDFLSQALESLSDKDHVFVFLHHPRWLGRGYTGTNWEEVHSRMVAAKNVSAVFAGHIHQMHFNGERDGIKYFALATTGGHLSADIPQAGLLHHMNVVTVRPNDYSVATIPVGAVINPERFTPEFLEQVSSARNIVAERVGPFLPMTLDGVVDGEYKFKLTNPTDSELEIAAIPTVADEPQNWSFSPDHLHTTLPANGSAEMSFKTRRDSDNGIEDFEAPSIRLQIDYLGKDFRIELPERRIGVDMTLATDDALFSNSDNKDLKLKNSGRGNANAIRIPSAQIDFPSGPFTLEAWINPSSIVGSRGIVAKTQGSEYALFLQDGSPLFDVRLGLPGSNQYFTARSNSRIKENQWTHVAGVFDGQQIRLYINGKKVNELPAQGERIRNNLSLYVGADPNNSDQATRGFDGQIDEVRLSRGVRYTSDFEPVKRHERDDAAILLLHFDKIIGPFVLNDSANETLPTIVGQVELVERN